MNIHQNELVISIVVCLLVGCGGLEDPGEYKTVHDGEPEVSPVSQSVPSGHDQVVDLPVALETDEAFRSGSMASVPPIRDDRVLSAIAAATADVERSGAVRNDLLDLLRRDDPKLALIAASRMALESAGDPRIASFGAQHVALLYQETQDLGLRSQARDMLIQFLQNGTGELFGEALLGLAHERHYLVVSLYEEFWEDPTPPFEGASAMIRIAGMWDDKNRASAILEMGRMSSDRGLIIDVVYRLGSWDYKPALDWISSIEADGDRQMSLTIDLALSRLR